MNYFIIDDGEGVFMVDVEGFRLSLVLGPVHVISVHDTQYEAERGLAREIQLRGE